MTAQSKTTIKSYFETGDKPTAAQFVDFIDSYVDTGSAVTALTGDVTLGTVANGTAVATIASAAVTGTKLEARSVSLAKLGFGTVGQIYYCDVSGVPSLLAAGTSGQSLQMTATIPAWVSAAASTSTLTLLGTATASNSSTLDFTSLLSSSYSKYILVFNQLLNSASASIGLKISSDNGSTWTTVLYSQLWNIAVATNTAPSYTNVNGATPAVISDAQQLKFNGEANFSVNAANGIVWEGTTDSGTAGTNPFKSFVIGGGAALVNAIRLLPSSGNFTSGTVYLYGVKNT